MAVELLNNIYQRIEFVLCNILCHFIDPGPYTELGYYLPSLARITVASTQVPGIASLHLGLPLFFV